MFTPDCLSLLSCYEYRRKTDFFSGASPEKVEEILLKVVRKQQSLNASTMEAKKKEQEKEEKKRRERIQREKEKEAEEKRKELEAKKSAAGEEGLHAAPSPATNCPSGPDGSTERQA